jgi:UDP-glucose 4-epimerase
VKVAITGATGLIGQKIVEELFERGFALTCLSRREQVNAPEGIKWQVGDLAVDGVAEQIVDGQDVVVHLAHATVPLSVAANPLDGLQAGIVPTLKLIAAAKRCPSSPRIIYLSSGGAIYGEAVFADQLCRETDRCEPLTEYGIQKLVIERYLHSMAMAGGVRSTVLRVSNAYGALLNPNRMQGLIGTSVARMLQGQSLRLIGSPHNVRDYVHVTDIASAVSCSLQHSADFGIFNIGSGMGYTVLEVMDMISRIGGGGAPVEVQDVRGSNLLASRNVLDVAKAKAELGWSPTISLEAGIRSMFEASSAK